MRTRSFCAGTSLLAVLGGCALYVDEPKLGVQSEFDGWDASAGLKSHADASLRARLADVVVSVRADDPFTPVRATVRPGATATVTVLSDRDSAGTAGAWRLGDRAGRYFRSRVPRAFAFGDALNVPAGTDLLLEFDPRTVVEGETPSEGDVVAFALRIESGAETEMVPVALRVAEVDRNWRIQPMLGH